jgi:hypothetical protein
MPRSSSRTRSTVRDGSGPPRPMSPLVRCRSLNSWHRFSSTTAAAARISRRPTSYLRHAAGARLASATSSAPSERLRLLRVRPMVSQHSRCSTRRTLPVGRRWSLRAPCPQCTASGTVASRALLAGESIDEVAFLLGHRDANVTRAVYLRELSDARRRTMRRSRISQEFAVLLDPSS